MATRLQDQKIKALRPPAAGRLEVKDAIVPGLMLRVTPGGVKSFCLVFKVPGEHPGGPSKTGKPRCGKPHRMTLGTSPGKSLAAAREEARRLLEQVDLGIDPRPARTEAAQAAYDNTVASVAKRFIAQECKGHIKSWRRVERTLELHVLPTLGNRPIKEIRRGDIHTLIDNVIADVGPGAGREVLKHTHHLLDFAYDREYITSNPAHKLKRKDLKTNGDAGRALGDEELRAIWKAAEAIGYPYGPWIKLLILTGARRGDWANASRVEIDNEQHVLSIPASRYKTGVEHSIPLGDEAWDIVRGLPVWNEGDYLFSTTGGVKAINSAGAAKKKIDALAPTDVPWRIHDFRVTCKSRMSALGIDPGASEAVLGHMKKGMDAIYNKNTFEIEKRAALTRYAQHVMEVVGR